MSSAPVTRPANHSRSRDTKWFPILRQTASDWVDDNAMRLSAALSLYTILSLAPLLVITIKVVGVVWRNADSAREQITQQLTSLMGKQVTEALRPMLESSGKNGHGEMAALISFGVLIFSATGVFVELQDALNNIWSVKPKPRQGVWGFIRNRLLSVTMVFGIAFLLLVSMFFSTLLTSMAHVIAGDAQWLAFIADIVVSYAVVSLLFGAIFKVLPDVELDWSDVWVGAVVTAALFTIGKYGLTLYFKYATPTSAFGAAGSLAAVLLWVYYSSFILFFGAEFTKVWAVEHGHRIKPLENAMKVSEITVPMDADPSRATEAQINRFFQSLQDQSDIQQSKARHSNEQNAHIQPSATPFVLAAGVLAGGIAITYLVSQQVVVHTRLKGIKLRRSGASRVA